MVIEGGILGVWEIMTVAHIESTWQSSLPKLLGVRAGLWWALDVPLAVFLVCGSSASGCKGALHSLICISDLFEQFTFSSICLQSARTHSACA